MKVIWFCDLTFLEGRPMVALIMNHHFKLHFGIAHHIVDKMNVAGALLFVFLKEILRGMILLGSATQAMSLSTPRQVTKLWLFLHPNVRRALNCGNAFYISRAWITFLKRCNCMGVKNKETFNELIRTMRTRWRPNYTYT